MRMNLTQAAQAMHAEPSGLPDTSYRAGSAEEILLTGASMDSRVVRSGDVFFCLPGTRVDGHAFAAQAVQSGAVAVAASRRLPEVESSVPVLLVQDTTRALGELARAWRTSCAARVVGVTGSAGKTTVKEMLAQVCSVVGKTCKNPLNRNNQIGMPLSLLACEGTELSFFRICHTRRSEMPWRRVGSSATNGPSSGVASSAVSSRRGLRLINHANRWLPESPSYNVWSKSNTTNRALSRGTR